MKKQIFFVVAIDYVVGFILLFLVNPLGVYLVELMQELTRSSDGGFLGYLIEQFISIIIVSVLSIVFKISPRKQLAIGHAIYLISVNTFIFFILSAAVNSMMNNM